MLEFKPITGVRVTVDDLRSVCETPLSGLRKLAKKVVDVVEGRAAYLYGGALRNYLWKVLGKSLPNEHKVDADILVTTDMAFKDVISSVSGVKEFSPLLVVSVDTLRAVLPSGQHVDFKFTPSVRYAMLDFTVNAVVAPLDDLFGRGAPVYCASLEDLDGKILRHISPFNAYPFHMVRGVRLAATYRMRFAPATLQEYHRKGKHIRDLSPPLVHRELAAAVNMGYEYAVAAAVTTGIVLELFPSLKNYAKKNAEAFSRHVGLAHDLLAVFREDEEVKKIAPPRLLEKPLAPGGRNILYCYFLAALLLPLSLDEKLLMEMGDVSLYPAERGVIALCLNAVRGASAPLEKAHPLVRPFLLAYRKVITKHREG